MQKTIWITGASSGIGREFARRYAAGLPAHPDCPPHRPAGSSCRKELPARPMPHPAADLSQRQRTASACARCWRMNHRHLHQQRGLWRLRQLLETDDAREEEMIRVNVAAMARLFRAVVRKMHAQGGGTILNVASSAGLLPGGPYMAGYYASKAYVVSLTRGVAEELREMHSPVYVCALCPGPVDTEFNDHAGVVFALRGITPELCVEEAMLGMMHRKTIIVPSAFMRHAPRPSAFCPFPC